MYYVLLGTCKNIHNLSQKGGYMESKLELQPLMSLFQEEMAQDCQLETQAFAADTTTVSPDGCAWSDPW